MKKSIIFDIDGTLADNQHRQHILEKNSSDWDEFFVLLDNDKPIIPVVELYQCLERAKLYKMLIVTGRPERYRVATENWLSQHSISYDKLYMRKDGDHQPDAKAKKEILNSILSDNNEILLVVDDRPETVAMWRDSNLACLQYVLES